MIAPFTFVFTDQSTMVLALLGNHPQRPKPLRLRDVPCYTKIPVYSLSDSASGTVSHLIFLFTVV